MSCLCPECHSLAEYMLNLTGKTYGLPPAPGHQGPVVQAPSDSMTDLSPAELKERQQVAKRRTALPWEDDYQAA